jgi:MoxR-like ATPase
MKPVELDHFLERLVARRMLVSTMIWGPPGIGKSSIVQQTAARHGLPWIDVRLSQLAPTDLRGLPVAEDGVARWYPPEFLPRAGAGVLFLDELNLAPPLIQGMAQQLILDRRVGSYEVPEGWFIWAAGNRKEDRAAVFDMPAPLANRFIHLHVEPDFPSFKDYALLNGVHERILAFLSFRPTLLHKLDARQPAWPSPRSWVAASGLYAADLPVEPAVGEAAAAEFAAYVALYDTIPDLGPILDGQGRHIAFSGEPSVRYATTIGLAARAESPRQIMNVFTWLADQAPAEWVQLCVSDMFRLARGRGTFGALAQLIGSDPRLQRFMHDYQQLLVL